MSLAFWNNPIIVSAFRVKYRSGGLFWGPTIYLLALALGGVVLYYFNDQIGGLWARNYFIGLMGVQFYVCLFTSAAAGTSIRQEILTHTLDFQRLTRLGPSAFLLGKLLGESAMGYLLPIAAFPLAFVCWLGGGVAFEVMLLFYVNLFTTTFMFGAAGLRQQLGAMVEVPGVKNRHNGGCAPLLFGFPLWILFGMGGSLGNLFSVPWGTALVGLYLPLPPFYGLIRGSPGDYTLPVFGHLIPLLLVTPVSQLFLTFLSFRSASRQIVKPMNVPVGRPMAYLALFVQDLVTAAVLFDMGSWSLTLGPRCAAFCLVHLVTSIHLTGEVTPDRTTLLSWMWRYRGHRPYLRDLWIGDRSENILALLTFAILGIVDLILWVVLPELHHRGAGPFMAEAPVGIFAALSMALLLIVYGTYHQQLVLESDSNNRNSTFVRLLPLIVVPHVLGEYLQMDALSAFSPSAQFWHWLSFDSLAPLSPWPMLGLFVVVFVLAWMRLRRRIRKEERVVDETRKQLEVVGTGAPE